MSTITHNLYVSVYDKQIDKLEDNEVWGAVCREGLVVLRYTNGMEKIEVVVYTEKDGVVEQTIQLDFIPAFMAQPLGGNKLIECDDDSLVLLGSDGLVRIYKYSTNTLPVYAIVLISIAGSIIFLALIVCAYRTCKSRIEKQKRNK